ncbi:MAG: AAA family ATPase [Balneola sp.]|nr:MAG: AAA family ATPase [Balneola sp.]
MNDQILNEISVLLKSHYHVINIETIDDDRAEAIAKEISDLIQIPFYIWSVHRGLFNYTERDVHPDTEDVFNLLSHISGSTSEGIYLLRGFKPFLDDIKVNTHLISLVDRLENDRSALFFTGKDAQLEDPLRSHVASIKLPLPSEDDFVVLLKQIYTDLKRKERIEINISKPDLDKLIMNLRGLTLFEAKKILTMIMVEDGTLTKDDIQVVIDSKKKLIEKEGLLEYYTAEESFGDIAALDGLKDWLKKRQIFVEKPDQAKKAGLIFPKGILLLGVPGTGKSLCAKAVSKEWGLPLLKMDPAKLYSKYIGETESKFNKAMEISEKMSPLILWIDEIEKAFASGGDADGGLSQRVIGSFLSWMQERKGDVFVIATANDVEKLPPEFLRKGRFDEIFFVDLPDYEARKSILDIHMKRREMALNLLNLERLAELTEGFSGAELEQVLIGALYSSFSNKTEITQEDIEEEIRSTYPLSQTFEHKIQTLREWAKTRTVSAN